MHTSGLPSFHPLVLASFNGAQGLATMSRAVSIALDLLVASCLLAFLATAMLDAVSISLVELVALGVLAELTQFVDSATSIQARGSALASLALFVVVSAGFLGQHKRVVRPNRCWWRLYSSGDTKLRSHSRCRQLQHSVHRRGSLLRFSLSGCDSFLRLSVCVLLLLFSLGQQHPGKLSSVMVDLRQSVGPHERRAEVQVGRLSRRQISWQISTPKPQISVQCNR